MGEDCGSWFPQQHPEWKSPNLISYSTPLVFEQQNMVPVEANPCGNMVYANGALPAYAFSELSQQVRLGQASEPGGSFYQSPQFEHGFVPASDHVARNELPAGPHGNCRVATMMPNAGSGCTRKTFLVFDHSGDQTKLIFSSGIGDPVQRLTSWISKPTGTNNLNIKVPGTKSVLNHVTGQVFTEEFDENRGTDMQSEMHEDTEELNALLYSDDESDYTDDDEVTSTGHSPSTMTANNNCDWLQGSTEEIASSIAPSKKRKILNRGYEDVPSVVDTASSVKPARSTEHEGDAESSCGNSKNIGSGETGSSGNKKMRKDKIRETISILQHIIPEGKGKDAVMFLDEAIHYLKSLKFKAQALGLTSF